MTKLLGIIAEDTSDIDVLHIIVKKIARKPFSVRRNVGHGCGRIRKQCAAWAKSLKDRGCHLLLIVHDLDANNLQQLGQNIREALGVSPIAEHIIVIPVRELEAWLLADHKAIEKTFRFNSALGKISNPEGILRPKERLRDLIYQKTKNRIIYVNTIHNAKIAENCAIANLRRCGSFQPFESFITRTLR